MNGPVSPDLTCAQCGTVAGEPATAAGGKTPRQAVTASELIVLIAACQTCGKEHQPRQISQFQQSWASADDGHNYSPALPLHIIGRLREFTAGEQP